LFVESYTYESAQLQMVEESHARHELGLAVLYALKEKFDVPGMEDRLLQVMEKSQAIIFRQELFRNQLAQFTDSSRLQYVILQRQIGDVRQQIALGGEADAQLALSAALNQLLQERERLLAALLASVAQVGQSSFTNPSTVRQVQAFIQARPQTLFLQYFWGEEHLYILAIAADTFQIRQIEITPDLLRWQEAAIQAQAQPAGHDATYFQSFIANRHEGYQRLIEPVFPHDSIAHLIIVPSGPLIFTSPETYITHATNDSKATYATLPYLLKSADIRYVYSPGLMLHPPVNQQAASAFALPYLGVAPAYGKEAGLRALGGGIDLIQWAADYLGGDRLMQQAATKEAFGDKLENQTLGVLHFHGHADTTQGSWLAFAPDKEADDHLFFMQELYGLSFRAQLILLSACQSGIGKIVKGEGIMHLGRAMQLAGGENIILQLWEADEDATTVITR
ncbi:MAG: CHAT domain-containing protein, partial [Bacteroidota bacterium]